MKQAAAQDRVRLQGTELYGEGRRLAAVLERCEAGGLRVRLPDGKARLLEAGAEVLAASLDLADGRLRVELSAAGRAALGLAGGGLEGQGFRVAADERELRERQAVGEHRLRLDAIDLRPEARPEDALILSLDYFSAEGLRLHLPEAGAVTVPWADIERAALDLLGFRLLIAFKPGAVARHGWLSGVFAFTADVRR